MGLAKTGKGARRRIVIVEAATPAPTTPRLRLFTYARDEIAE